MLPDQGLRDLVIAQDHQTREGKVVKAFFPTSMKVKGPLFSSRPCIGAVIVEAMAAAVVFSVKEALCVVGLVSRFCHRVCGHVRVVDIPGNIVL